MENAVFRPVKRIRKKRFTVSKSQKEIPGIGGVLGNVRADGNLVVVETVIKCDIIIRIDELFYFSEISLYIFLQPQ